MIVLGLVLIGFAVLLAAGVAASSGNRATLDIFGVGFDTRSSVVFFFGVAIGVALIAGLWLTKHGLARGYRRRKEVRQLRQQVQAAPVADLPAERSDQHDDESGRDDVATGNEVGEPVGQHRAGSGPMSEPDPGSDVRMEPDRQAAESPVSAPRDLPRRHTEVRE